VQMGLSNYFKRGFPPPSTKKR